MGRAEASEEQLLATAKARNYVPGVHQTEDIITAKEKNYTKKTIKDQNTALRLYEKWRNIVNKERTDGDAALPPSLDKNAPPPDLATILDFVRFHAATSKGLIDNGGLITVESSNTFMEWFFAGFTRLTGTVIDEETRSTVYKWTRTALVKEQLVITKKKTKYLFGKEEFIQFNITFWTVDDAVFVHPRNKVQIPLISVFTWTGARIGAFLPGPNEKNRGLRYKDVEVVLMRIPEGRWKPIYRVDQRWVKNNRDPENTTFGASTSQHDIPLYDDTQHLLSMAIADKAFFGIASMEDLDDQQIPEGENELILRWNDSALDLPIVRNATMGRGITNEPLPKAAFERIFKKVLEQSGYFGYATVHAIRRYLGKKVDESYTAVERSQHLTQSDPRVFGDKYVANTSSVDGKRAFLHEVAQHDHVDYFQSFAKFCERGLPTSLPAAQSTAVRQDPQLLALTDQVSQLIKENAPASDLKTAKSKAHSCHSKLIKKALKEYQLEWVKNRRDSKILTRGKVQPDTGIQPDLLHIMSLIFPECRRLAQAMIVKEKASDEERRQIRKDLYSLISRDYLVVYLPGEEPVDGFCPVATCGAEISSLRKDRRSTHVHTCHHKERAFRLERLPAEVKYCYLCFGWIVEEDWNEHCQFHLQRLTSMRCGSFTNCSTLIRPAFYPFCVGNNRLDASRRLSSWIRDRQLRDHLEAHLRETSWPGRCPFPLCDLEVADEVSFLYHLSDVHYLKIGPNTDVYKQERDNESRIIHWEPFVTIGKRKREDGEVAEMQTVSPHMLSKVPLLDDGLSDLPDLIYSGSASSPDNEESCSFTFHDMPGTESDKNRICSTDETLFSLYLRSRSSSCSPENGTIEGATTSGTLSNSDVRVLKIADAGCAQPIQDSIEPPINQPEIKKPRIILRVRPPKTKARSKTTIQSKEPQKHSPKRLKSKPKPIPKIRLRLGKLSQRT